MAFLTKDIFTFDHTAQADYPQWVPSTTKTNMNARGEELRLALNAVVNLLNATTVGASGAKNIAMTPIAVIGTQADVQTVVEAIVTRLQAVTAGLSGAKFVGVETIAGLTGNDVQVLLSALKTLSDTYNTNQTGALTTHKASADHDSRYATAAQGTLATNALPAVSYTAADVLTKIKTVDGAGSGLDADLLAGLAPTSAATVSTIMQRDAAGRAKVVAPSAVDDIARKDTVDAVQTNLDTHKTSTDHDGRYFTEAELGATTGGGLVGATAPSGLTGTTVQALINALNTASNTHIANTTTAHGATTLSTANTIALRDANGNVVSNLPVSRQNPNLAFNSSFRLALAGWTLINKEANTTVTTPFDANGGEIVFTSSIATTDNSFYDSAPIPVVAGDIYTLSVEMSTLGQTVGTVPSMEIDWYDVGSVLLSVSYLVASAIGLNYTKYSLTDTAPTGAVTCNLRVVYRNTVISTFTGFREIKFEKGSVATTYSDDNTLNTVQYGSVLPLAQILSGGNKKQSGTSSVIITTAGTAVAVTVTFAVPFTTVPTITLGITSATGDAGYNNVRASTVSTTAVTFTGNSYLAQTLGFNWEATGT